ncbi:MAG: hypothetical protein KA310_03380 [Pseudomonadales bacterium]|nr:hypothetical protein [Pseudomonadales bacterium]
MRELSLVIVVSILILAALSFVFAVLVEAVRMLEARARRSRLRWADEQEALYGKEAGIDDYGPHRLALVRPPHQPDCAAVFDAGPCDCLCGKLPLRKRR